MVWLLAHEYEVEPIRATENIDVVVDIRAKQRLLMRMCAWLDGIGHRYVSDKYNGPGKVAFDILAPDNVSERAILTTFPPARMVSAPGTRGVLDSA